MKNEKAFYSDLNSNAMTENTFWKTVKPFLSYKTNKTLIVNERFISKDHQIAKPFNKYFISTPIKNMPKN